MNTLILYGMYIYNDFILVVYARSIFSKHLNIFLSDYKKLKMSLIIALRIKSFIITRNI